jgi:hypothetical protein
VLALAGRVAITDTVFGITFPLAGDAGDLVVGTASATARHSADALGGSAILDCGEFNIALFAFPGGRQTCMHTTETSDNGFGAQLIARVGRMVRADQAISHPGLSSKLGLADARLPAGVCRRDAGPVQMHGSDGESSAPSATRDWGGGPTFYVHLTNVRASGDITGDGRSDLAVAISCEGYGGGNNHFPHVIVLSGRPDALTLAADVQPFGYSGGVDHLSVTSGALTANTLLYRDNDANCCPSGHGVSRWRWRDGELQSIGQRTQYPVNDDLPYGKESRCHGSADLEGQVVYAMGVGCADARRAATAYRGDPPDPHGLPGWTCGGFQNGVVLCNEGDAIEAGNDQRYLSQPHIRVVPPGGAQAPST